MTDEFFEPPPVPLCSKTLVATLKQRLYEAINDGKASEAKTFLDIIERLAKMAWLDELSAEERDEALNEQAARKIAHVDTLMAQYLNEQGNQKGSAVD
jgi:hypothetical protein